MTTKHDSVLLTISDIVAQSICNKKLQADYPDILNLCRNSRVSSYTLHQIIEQELVNSQDKEERVCRKIGFVRVVIPEKPFEGKLAAGGNLPSDDVSPTKKAFLWGWKTWFLFTVLLVSLIVIIFIIYSNSSLQALFKYQLENLL